VTSVRHAVSVLDRARSARVFSAVAAEVGNASGPLWSYAGGSLAFDDPTPADAATVFDLASLTKVLSTTTIAVLLTRREKLDVNEAVARVLREWTARDRASVTIGDLLEHSSGLPAHREYFRRLQGIGAYLHAIAAEPLEYPPRSASLYSDLGFIALGSALERLGGAPLHQQFDGWWADVGGAEPLAYLPPAEWKTRIAATEFDEWRGRRLQGEVHDQNAAALGGVAAHAGLFGTAAAVGVAARWWLEQLETPVGQRFAERSCVPGSSRALGWDRMLPTSSCGSRMSTRAIGHTGFTGTSLWIDPSSGLYFVLLTNRIHASKHSDAIQHLRREFHDAANGDLT
jgi:CubicO group peptidase (beta-lactamase class C family)